jgi:putative flippase GtrA
MSESSLASAIRSAWGVHSQGRMLRYLLIGSLSFVVDLGVLVALRQGAHAPLWVATTAAYWTGFCVNFSLQRTVTFAARGAVGSQLWRYAALVVVNFAGTLLIVQAASAAHIGYATGKVLAVMLFVIVNYMAYNLWVFRSQELSDVT